MHLFTTSWRCIVDREELIEEIKNAILDQINVSYKVLDVLECVIPQGLETWPDDELRELCWVFQSEEVYI